MNETDSSTISLRIPMLAGTVLGLLLVAWTFVMGLTGWYLDRVLLHLFWVSVVIQAAVLVVTLLRTRQGRKYRAQVGVGLMTSAVAAVWVFLGSLVFTTWAFPTYFEDLREAQAETLRAEGMAEKQVDATLEEAAPSRTPGGQAFAGFMGTLGMGLVVSGVAAVFLRDRRERA